MTPPNTTPRDPRVKREIPCFKCGRILPDHDPNCTRSPAPPSGETPEPSADATAGERATLRLPTPDPQRIQEIAEKGDADARWLIVELSSALDCVAAFGQFAALVARYLDPNRHGAIRDDRGYWESQRESDKLKAEIMARLATLCWFDDARRRDA